MKDKINLKNIVAVIVLIACIIRLGISILEIIDWKIDSNKTIKQIEKINDIVKIEEIEDNDQVIDTSNDTEIIEEEIPKNSPYFDYLKMNLIYVDFSELENINSDVVGWIQVNGTNVNYPFVHTSNNDFYLNHSFDKSYNSGGWVFLDYRNDENLSKKNNIIYAHNMQDETMFGSLKKVLTNEWLSNTDNHVIKLSTNNESTLWQIFSVYNIETTSDYLKVDFEGDEFLSFINMLKDRSSYDFKTNISENDKILTLSTCYKKTHKTVVHAKLLKKEAR